jgi:hypothetical protein
MRLAAWPLFDTRPRTALAAWPLFDTRPRTAPRPNVGRALRKA